MLFSEKPCGSVVRSSNGVMHAEQAKEFRSFIIRQKAEVELIFLIFNCNYSRKRSLSTANAEA